MQKIVKLLLILIFTCTVSQACNLAMHEWELTSQFSLPLPGPLVPASEFSTLATRFVPSEISKILWVSDSFATTGVNMWLKEALIQWTSKVNFLPTTQADLGKHSISSTTLLLEPCEYTLQVALFSDKLSSHRCRQLVIMQQGRIKLAMPKAERPVAEQHYSRAWVSIFFFDHLVPGKILSVSASPVRGHLEELFVDYPFVESLMIQNMVRRRPDNYQSPYVDGFPAFAQ